MGGVGRWRKATARPDEGASYTSLCISSLPVIQHVGVTNTVAEFKAFESKPEPPLQCCGIEEEGISRNLAGRGAGGSLCTPVDPHAIRPSRLWFPFLGHPLLNPTVSFTSAPECCSAACS